MDRLTPKQQINRAFRQLKKAGFYARQGTPCCMSCSLAIFSKELRKMSAEQRKAIRGIVYFHRQDAEVFAGRGDTLFVRFSCTSLRPIRGDGPTIEVGKAAVEALRAAGLDVTWNGRADTCIRVTVRPSVSRCCRLTSSS